MSDSEKQNNSSGTGRTIAIVVAILVAGGMVAGAIVYVSAQGQPREATTTSAQTAWEHSSAGWSCEIQEPDGTTRPINTDLLATFAEIENASRADGSVEEFFASTPVVCTEPGS